MHLASLPLSTRPLQAPMSGGQSCRFCFKVFKSPVGLRVHQSKKVFCRNAFRDQIERTAKEKARHQTNALLEPSAVPPLSPSLTGLPPSPSQPDFQAEWMLDDAREFAPEFHPRPNPAYRVPLPDEQRVDMLGDKFDAMFVEPFPEPAGRTYGQKETAFEARLRAARQRGLENNLEWEKARWSPFAHQDEWELAEWMAKRLGKNEVEEFLRLSIVSSLPCVVAGSLSVVRSSRSTCRFGAPTCFQR
jgi:hypothetical protein